MTRHLLVQEFESRRTAQTGSEAFIGKNRLQRTIRPPKKENTSIVKKGTQLIKTRKTTQ